MTNIVYIATSTDGFIVRTVPKPGTYLFLATAANEEHPFII